MKIIIDLFQDKDVGGTEIATYRIAKELAGRGHEVYIVTKYSKGLLKRQSKDDFTIIRTLRWRIPILGTIIYNIVTYFKIRYIKPDIIHVQGFSTLGLFLRFFIRTPYVIWGRGLKFTEGFSYLEKLMAWIILAKASVVVALTKNMSQKFQEVFNKRAIIIPTGVDISRFDQPLVTRIRRKFTDDSKRGKIILFVGNLLPIKGVEYLIEAMEWIIQEYPEACLILVGKDFQRGRLQRIVQDKRLEQKITFAGFVSPNEIPKYMVASDIFVLPSLSEGLPNVLLEAMAAGLPIVATRVGGVPEIITDGENGFLVEAKNSHQLADKIRLLLKDDDIRKQFQTNNIEKAKKYSWPDVVTSLEQVYLKAKKH